MRLCAGALALLSVLLSLPYPGHALIILGPADNLLPPLLPSTETLTEWVGELGNTNTPGFLGTPIGPRHFITAAHLEFGPGNVFLFRGQSYVITARTNLPQSDLTVATVDGVFPAYAPLYERDDETHRTALILGKGRWKGDPVLLNNELRGWRFSDSGVPGIRWGTNSIERTVSVDNPAPGALSGSFLVADFNASAGQHEVYFTVGDSGAPLFIADCGEWKLAGLASAIDGPFQPTGRTNDPPFLAALFDARGFSTVREGTGPEPIPDPGKAQPASWYAARLHPYRASLHAIVGGTTPPNLPPPPDRFAWRSDPDPTRVEITTGAGPVSPPFAIECVDEISRAGLPVRWNGQIAEYQPGDAAPAIDSFRFVARDSAGATSWGVVYLVLRPLPTAPRTVTLHFDGDRTLIALWPDPFRREAGQRPSTRASLRAEWAAEPSGPWFPFTGTATWLNDYAVFADRNAPEATRRFYRLVSASGE